MSPGHYFTSLIVLSCLLLYFGLHLILGKIPEMLRGGAYEQSRRFMGAAFLVLALSVVIFFATMMNTKPVQYRIALNVSSYFIASKLFILSYLSLIGQRLSSIQPLTRWTVTFVFIFPIIVWITPFIGDLKIVQSAQIVEATIFFIGIIVDIVYLFRCYSRVVLNGEYYYSDGGARVRVKWIIKSVYLMIGVGLFSATAALLSSVIPKWILFVYLIYFVATSIYIFSRFLHFVVVVCEAIADQASDSMLLQLTPSDPDMSKIRFSSNTYQNLRSRLLVWVESKEYCKQRSTILTAANFMSTNRLYLSNYINSTYNCSFRLWVSRLRIEESKKRFRENPDATITSIAESVGFQSLTSFTHAFKNAEGMAPKEWIRDNC